MSAPFYVAAEQPAASMTVSVDSGSLKEELSRNGNVVTEYVNEEDGQLKTILWAKGITPPKMGGEDSQFKKQIIYDGNGKPAYIDYIAPYMPGNGWYDVNKSENFVNADLNLCFAAASSNSLHWWMDQNAENISRYLEMNPDDVQIQKLNTLRNSFENQRKSGVYDIFLRQFGNRQEGYWPDILQDQFINGYYPKANGGTNDSPADREKLLEKGPDQNGGFFFKVFGTDLLTQRRYYYNGYDALNRELKELFLEGSNVLMNYKVGVNNHVVTLWGVEFDPSGNVCAVYYSDSDDEASQGMMRFRLLNVNGQAIVTTQVDGKSRSLVECLQILSTGTRQWKEYFKEEKTTLDLVWSNTELVYNGQLQLPTVAASNIAPEDDVQLSVEGGQINAGVYTARAALKGADAKKYELPTEHTRSFEIKKAAAPEIVYPSAGELQYGQKLSQSVLSGGSEQYGRFFWQNGDVVPAVNNIGYPVRFEASELVLQNYEPILNVEETVSVPVSKTAPVPVLSAKVEHTADFSTVTFSVQLDAVGYGEVPTGTISLVVLGEAGEPVLEDAVNIPLQNGCANVVWTNAANEKLSAKVVYTGDENYNEAESFEIAVDARKQNQKELQLLPIGPKTYGEEDFLLETSGGSGSGAVTFESSNPEIIEIQGNTAVIHKAGNAVITAKKAADEVYNAAAVSQVVTISKKSLVVAAEDKLDVLQGDPMPDFTYTVTGLVGKDTFAKPEITVSVSDTNAPGEYEIFIQGGQLTHAESYAVQYKNGRLTIREKEAPPQPTPGPTVQPSPEPTAKPTETPVPVIPSPAPTEEPVVNPIPTAEPAPAPTAIPQPNGNNDGKPTQSSAAVNPLPAPVMNAAAPQKEKPTTTAKPSPEPERSGEVVLEETSEPTATPKPTERPEETLQPAAETTKPVKKTGFMLVKALFGLLAAAAAVVIIRLFWKRNRHKDERQ